MRLSEFLGEFEFMSHSDPLPDRWIEYFDICGEPITGKTDVVFFATSSDRSSGWYSQPFDRSIYLKKLCRKNPKWIYVIRHDDRLPKQAKYWIRVKSLEASIAAFIRFHLSVQRITVIGVTGSVGKTTLTRMLADVMERSFNTALLETKRTTPLGLFDFILNRMNSDTQMLICELGLYDAHHVHVLSEILRPKIGILLNVRDMHTGRFGLHDLYDIASAKAHILTLSSHGVVNSDALSYLFIEDRPNLHRFSITDVVLNSQDLYRFDTLVLRYGNGEIEIPFYLKTKTYIEQALALVVTCQVVGMPSHDTAQYIIEAVTNKKNYKLTLWKSGKGCVLIDRHASYRGYFEALSENYYEYPVLVIASLYFVEESLSQNILYIVGLFNRYTKVMINKKLRSDFRTSLPKNVKFSDLAAIQNEIEFERNIHLHDPMGFIIM